MNDGQICEKEAGKAKKKRLRVKGKFYVLLRKVLSGSKGADQGQTWLEEAAFEKGS